MIDEGTRGGFIAIMRRPSPEWLEDDLSKLSEMGVHHILSLLTAEEVNELGLQAEPAASRACGITFYSFPIPDRGTPDNETAFIELIHKLSRAERAGHGVAVHCRAGIGRSGLAAAALLVSRGFDAAEAFDLISERRRVTVPDTGIQKTWIRERASALSSLSDEA